MEPLSRLPGLQDRELISLATDIPHTSYSKLCDVLGFSFARGQSILATQGRDFKAAVEIILFDWKTQQGDANQTRPALARKFREISLHEVETKTSEGAYLQNQENTNDQVTIPRQPDVYNKRISESLTVAQCREKLKNQYLHDLCRIPMNPWDKGAYAELNSMHTVVTVVKKDRNGVNTGMNEIVHGSVDGIFSTEVNGTLPARILLSAEAGRGKTTAVAKIAYDWAHREQGSALEHLPLLFVVKLRKTDKQISIGAAIKSQLLRDVRDLSPEDLEDFIWENQSICHIIFDGLDEYAGINSGSNINKIIKWVEYPECRVLVTTRPHLKSFFNEGDLPRVYTQMSIKGFSRDSSREYVTRFFTSTEGDNDEGKRLNDYIDKEPLITELVTTPLFCLMVCHLWKKGKLKKSELTQTELLDEVNYFMMEHANLRANSAVKFTPKVLRTTICEIGKVALDGILNEANKLIFTPDDFRKVPVALDRACALGIVSRTPNPSQDRGQNERTTIEFYHKLAQEHSAGKYLAAESKRFLWPWQTSEVERVLCRIEANIGEYENLIRFAAGTENSLFILIMEAILANSSLTDSERYRLLLDCSSERSGTEGNVSSYVRRLRSLAEQRIVLNSPNIYTVSGMQKLPRDVKDKVTEVQLDGPPMTEDVTLALWSCLGSFSSLRYLTISDSSYISPNPHRLPSVTKLKAQRMTSQCYEGLLSSMPNLKSIDVTIDNDERNTSQIMTSRPVGQVRDQLVAVHLTLQALPSLSEESGEVIAEMSLQFIKQTEGQPLLQVSGLEERDEKALVDLFVKTTRLKSFIFERGSGSSLYGMEAIVGSRLYIEQCKLTTEMTHKLWSYLGSFTSLTHLTILDDSLSFPPSPPQLPSVTRLKAERVTSHSYEGLLTSMPNLKGIDVTIDTDERNTSQMTSRPVGQARDQQLAVHITLRSSPSSTGGRTESGKTISELSLHFSKHTQGQQLLQVSGLKERKEEALVDLFVKSRHLQSLNLESGSGSLRNDMQAIVGSSLEIKNCKLTTKVTKKLWSYLGSFTSVAQLTILDGSLSFPPNPHRLPSVTSLKAERVKSHSYQGLLSSMPNLKSIDVTIDNEERNTSQMTSTLPPVGQTRDQLFAVHITLRSSPSPSTGVGTETSETIAELNLQLSKRTEGQQLLQVSGLKGRDEKTLVDLFVKTKHLQSLNLETGSGSLRNDMEAIVNSSLEIKNCKLTTKMTHKLWSYLGSFTSLAQLTILGGSLSCPQSPPQLPSVTRLKADRVVLYSYQDLLSSMPSLKSINATIAYADTVISQIFTWPVGPVRGQLLPVHIILRSSPSPSTRVGTETSEMIAELNLQFSKRTEDQRFLQVSGLKGRDEENLVDVFVKTTHLQLEMASGNSK